LKNQCVSHFDIPSRAANHLEVPSKGLSQGQKPNVNELVRHEHHRRGFARWYVEAGLVALILQIGALIEGVATNLPKSRA